MFFGISTLHGCLLGGGIPLELPKARSGFYNYKRECPHADGLALTLEFAVEEADRAYGDESSAQVLFDYVLLMESSCFEVSFESPSVRWVDMNSRIDQACVCLWPRN